MLKTLLVGLDGSPHSDAALDLAISWARQRDLLLAGLAVVDEPGIRAGTPTPLGGDFIKDRLETEALHTAEVHCRQHLERFALRCSQAKVACKELETRGTPAQQILHESQRFDLVVLGQETHFRTGDPDEADDTLTHVLRHGSRPVLCVPKTTPRNGRTVLVAYDGSVHAARTLQLFTLLQPIAADTIHVVTVADTRGHASRIGERAADFLRQRQLPAEVHAETGGHTGELLVKRSQETGAALVVMGCFGKSAVREFFFGSTTRKMLTASPAPLFLAH